MAVLLITSLRNSSRDRVIVIDWTFGFNGLKGIIDPTQNENKDILKKARKDATVIRLIGCLVVTNQLFEWTLFAECKWDPEV